MRTGRLSRKRGEDWRCKYPGKEEGESVGEDVGSSEGWEDQDVAYLGGLKEERQRNDASMVRISVVRQCRSFGVALCIFPREERTMRIIW